MLKRHIWHLVPVVMLGLTLIVGGPRLAERFSGQAQSRSGAQQVTLVAAGDILVHPPTWQQAEADAAPGQQYEFERILAGVKPVVQAADLALCHMEAPMGPGVPQDFPRFNAPPQLARAVAATGFDGCSTASNHAMDQGEKGVAANLAALDAAGLPHTGTARTAHEAASPRIYNVKGVKIGHVSAAYGINRGTAVPAGKPWMVQLMDVPQILAAAHRLRAAGAQIVVVSCHWGTERVHRVTSGQQRVAQQLTASPDVDLIIGHHAHVVQPAYQVNGKWVYFGVGNLLARHDFPKPANKSGILPRVTFGRDGGGRWRVVRVEAVPVWLSLAPQIRVVDLAATIGAMSDVDRRRWKYARAWREIVRWLDAVGARRAGLRVAGQDIV